MNEKKQSTYVKPETKEQALATLKNLQTEIYSRFKGRVLGLIEGWFNKDSEKVSYQMARDGYVLTLSTICSSISRKIDDCLEVLEKKK